jgi:hypothetical protein
MKECALSGSIQWQTSDKTRSIQTHQCETVDFTILLHAYLILTLNTTLKTEYVKRLAHTVVCKVCIKKLDFLFCICIFNSQTLRTVIGPCVNNMNVTSY